MFGNSNRGACEVKGNESNINARNWSSVYCAVWFNSNEAFIATDTGKNSCSARRELIDGSGRDEVFEFDNRGIEGFGKSLRHEFPHSIDNATQMVLLPRCASSSASTALVAKRSCRAKVRNRGLGRGEDCRWAR